MIPNIRRANSDQFRALMVADFDSGKKVPISPYALAGALGFAIQGVAVIIMLANATLSEERTSVGKG